MAIRTVAISVDLMYPRRLLGLPPSLILLGKLTVLGPMAATSAFEASLVRIGHRRSSFGLRGGRWIRVYGNAVCGLPRSDGSNGLLLRSLGRPHKGLISDRIVCKEEGILEMAKRRKVMARSWSICKVILMKPLLKGLLTSPNPNPNPSFTKYQV